MSDEEKLKRSLSNTGIKRSQETIDRMSESGKIRYEREMEEGLSPIRKGYKKKNPE